MTKQRPNAISDIAEALNTLKSRYNIDLVEIKVSAEDFKYLVNEANAPYKSENKGFQSLEICGCKIVPEV